MTNLRQRPRFPTRTFLLLLMPVVGGLFLLQLAVASSVWFFPPAIFIGQVLSFPDLLLCHLFGWGRCTFIAGSLFWGIPLAILLAASCDERARTKQLKFLAEMQRHKWGRRPPARAVRAPQPPPASR